MMLAAGPSIPAPHIEYSQLGPMLVVFGVATAGVLVEAFAPRPLRRPIHLVLALGGLAAAFVWTVVIGATNSTFAHGSAGHIAAQGAVAVEAGPPAPPAQPAARLVSSHPETCPHRCRPVGLVAGREGQMAGAGGADLLTQGRHRSRAPVRYLQVRS
jgi:hypothetical protein